MQFLDHYIEDGAEGGRQAAIDLHDLLVESLAHHSRSSVHWPIVVRIFLNLQGLADVYRASGIVGNGAAFRTFVQAFNGERRLFEFIDAGKDKEAADRKIQGMILLIGL